MQHVSFYRKYRPQLFADVLGQEMITSILRQEILDNNVNHAYLFSGMQGVGKTSTARILAQTINCLKPLISGERCRKCTTCVYSLEAMLDIHEIDAASNNGVEQIRSLQDDAIIAPVLGRYKVYIIDEVHMLSRSAFNAFLKILEEPPRHVVFVLATTEPEKLPATVLSRCQHFIFLSLQPPILLKLLSKISQIEKIPITSVALSLLANTTNGAVREALNLLEQLAASFRSIPTIDKSMVEKFLGYFQTTQIQTFLEQILEQKITTIWQTLQIWINQNSNFFKLTEKLIMHCNQLQVKARQNWTAFITVYPYFEAWKLNQLPLLQKISQICLQNLQNFQLTIAPRVIFEFCVLQLLNIQPLLSFNQQQHYLQILHARDLDLQDQTRKIWLTLAKPATPFQKLLAATKPLVITQKFILLVAETTIIHQLQNQLNKPELQAFFTKHQLANHKVEFLTFAMRDFLKAQFRLEITNHKESTAN